MSQGLPSPSIGVRATMRQLRSQPVIGIVISVTVLTTSYLVAATPRAAGQAIADDLLATVADAAPIERNLTVEQSGRYAAESGDDPFLQVEEAGQRFSTRAIPPTLRSVIDGDSFLADSAQFVVRPLPGEEAPNPFPVFLRFRHQDHIHDHVTVIEGKMPQPKDPLVLPLGGDCPTEPSEIEAITEELEASGPIEGLDCRLETVPQFEVAVSAETARDMGYVVGRSMLLQPDAEDRLFLGVSGESLRYQIVASISAIIELDDQDLGYWNGDPSLHRPTIQQNADLRLVRAIGLIDPEAYSSLLQALGGASWRYQWRFFVDPELVSTSSINDLEAELPPFELEYSAVAVRPQDFRVSTGLDGLLTNHLDQQEQISETVSLATAGLIASMAMGTLLLGALMTHRQRQALTLAQGRGASPGQVVVSRMYQALVLVVPAGLGGLWLAHFVTSPSSEPEQASLNGVAVVIVAALAMLVGSGISAVTAVAHTPRTSQARARLSGRAVFESLIVVLAVGSLMLLSRRRGVEVEQASTGGTDLLLAVTPSLVALAVALLSLNLYPWLVGGLARLGARHRGLTMMVGLRRTRDSRSVSRLPILVLVVCVSTAVAASSSRASLYAGQETASWLEVGGDFAVKGSGDESTIPASVNLGRIEGIEAFVVGSSFPRARVMANSRSVEATALAVDTAGYQSLTSGTSGDVHLPDAMIEPGAAGSAAVGEPIPVIVSDQWPGRVNLGLGDTFTLDLGRLRPVVRVEQVRTAYPDIPAGRPFVIVPLAALESISELPISPTVAYLRAGESAGPGLAATLAEQSPFARLFSRYEALDAVRSDPLVDWAGRSFSLVALSSVVFGLIAVAGAIVLEAGARRRDFGYLRTMGLELGQATAITALEQSIPVLFAILIGTLTGIWTTTMAATSADLGAGTGDVRLTSVSLDWTNVGWITLALASGVILGVVIFAKVSGRDQLGLLLRENPE